MLLGAAGRREDSVILLITYVFVIGYRDIDLDKSKYADWCNANRFCVTRVIDECILRDDRFMNPAGAGRHV